MTAQLHKFDLEERTFVFANNVRNIVYQLPKSIVNIEDGRQVTRSSGSVGANYIEANEALGCKDFLLRIKTSRKEAKETIYWLKLLKNFNKSFEKEIDILIIEANELMLIFNSIIMKKS